MVFVIRSDLRLGMLLEMFIQGLCLLLIYSISIFFFFFLYLFLLFFFFFSSRRRHTRYIGDWSSDVCSSDLIEMDLTPEGAGDMDPQTLAGLDLVLGAFHSKLRMRDDQTDRYFRGLDNPDIQVLAHPRGRIYNFRAGLSCDWQRVAHRAAETGTALEIDAYPDRQDLDVARLRIVAAEGAWVSIGTDAHTPAELVFLETGIAAPILAGVSRGRVLNLLSARELADRVGLIRATKTRDTNEGSTTWQGVSARASTRHLASPEDRASSDVRMGVDSMPTKRAPAAASLRTSGSKPRTPRRKG